MTGSPHPSGLPACPACGADADEPFISLTDLPVHGTAVFGTAEAARQVAVGDQELCLCPVCGLVFNRAFDAGLLDYTGSHEESQHNSPRFVAYAQSLTADWVERFGLRDAHVVEIGCGAGDFAAELLHAGAGRVTGVDPHFRPERVPPGLSGRLVADPSEFTAGHVRPGTAAVVCRHTLEHIPGLAAFGAEIVTGMRRAGVPAFLAEVPDLDRILVEGAFWDLQYEHCTYLTRATFAVALRRFGFAAVDVRPTYGDQYLVAEATGPGDPSDEPVPSAELDLLARRCRTFADVVRTGIGTWAEWLVDRSRAGDPVAVWGGGAKGLTFLSTLPAEAVAPVRSVVDINPGLQNHFMAGVGAPIVAPGDLVDTPPRSVVLMNPIYRDEVRADLDRLGLGSTELLTL